MEHEVYLPYAPAVVLSAFAEPRRVARCVPGLQPAQPGTPADRDAGPDALRGRLRLRVGSSSITYRGSLVVATGSDDGSDRVVVRAEGEEARGSGTVSLVLTVTARPVDEGAGCALTVEGRLTATGRVAELTDEQRESTGRRLLDRFAAALADELSQNAAPMPPSGGIGEPDDNERVIPGIPTASSPGGEPRDGEPAPPAPPGGGSASGAGVPRGRSADEPTGSASGGGASGGGAVNGEGAEPGGRGASGGADVGGDGAGAGGPGASGGPASESASGEGSVNGEASGGGSASGRGAAGGSVSSGSASGEGASDGADVGGEGAGPGGPGAGGDAAGSAFGGGSVNGDASGEGPASGADSSDGPVSSESASEGVANGDGSGEGPAAGRGASDDEDSADGDGSASGAGRAGKASAPVEPAASEPAAEPGSLGGRVAGRGEGTPSALNPERSEPSSLPAPEADHARRTMIGRSAEEVDHAPPRGRYAPEPAPEEGGRSGALLRWAAPAAALAVASAVALRRALRRR
ncbi:MULTISPECIES: SRPBCC domain-containing protein [Streptomyces]|nr:MULTISPECIES: SRPBCC domain-containing protein [Streptomyces]